MKEYFEYMDNIKVSDTLHQRLAELDAPVKRKHFSVWNKYSGVAAMLVLALLAGVALYGPTRPEPLADEANYVQSSPLAVPEIGEEEPDIAAEDPNGTVEPGMKTIGGYELENGEIVSYYMLPYIEYGMTENVAQMSLDWDLPTGSTRRDLTQADIDALFGNGKNLSDHLGWGGYTLTGWAAWYEDGSFWGTYIYGSAGPLDHFEFALTAGNTYPPSCIGYLDGVEQEIWGLSVTAYGHDSVAGPGGGVDASDRRVEFLKDGCGFRFDLTGVSRALTEERVSRLVRWVATEGLELDAITPDGAVLVHPWEADPNYSVGEPNWEDGVPEEDNTSAYDPNADMDIVVTAEPEGGETSAYDPAEAADPSYNAPSMETRSPG